MKLMLRASMALVATAQWCSGKICETRVSVLAIRLNFDLWIVKQWLRRRAGKRVLKQLLIKTHMFHYDNQRENSKLQMIHFCHSPLQSFDNETSPARTSYQTWKYNKDRGKLGMKINLNPNSKF